MAAEARRGRGENNIAKRRRRAGSAKGVKKSRAALERRGEERDEKSAKEAKIEIRKRGK